MALDQELSGLIDRCDAFAKTNKLKAGKNLSNAGIFLVASISEQRAYPLHWLLHVRSAGKSFDDNKRSNQSLRRHIPVLRQLGYTEIFHGEPGFHEVWDAVQAACKRLDVEPSNRTGGPKYTRRRFFAQIAEIERIANVAGINESACSFAKQQANAFQDRVADALRDTTAARRNRLKDAPTEAERVLCVVEGFRRNPDVVAERLYLAGGICDDCGREAPFRKRKNGLPYLEVHHVTPLSEGGPDTVENTRALCPNCHRKVHHG